MAYILLDRLSRNLLLIFIAVFCAACSSGERLPPTHSTASCTDESPHFVKDIAIYEGQTDYQQCFVVDVAPFWDGSPDWNRIRSSEEVGLVVARDLFVEVDGAQLENDELQRLISPAPPGITTLEQVGEWGLGEVSACFRMNDLPKGTHTVEAIVNIPEENRKSCSWTVTIR